MIDPTARDDHRDDSVTLPPHQPMPESDVTMPPSIDPNSTLASATTTPPASTDARAPEGYVIEKELGRGGMGVVYQARSIALHRPCALKMILSGAHSGSDEIERFRTEAQAIARLQHPGIVQVFEIGEHDGKPFMALEFCAGGSLDSVLAKNPLKPREAAALVKALAEAMQAAHEAQVVHRDLKPANVLLQRRFTAEDTEGRREAEEIPAVLSSSSSPRLSASSAVNLLPKITDFGLAKKLDEEGATRTGSVMGTPSYMPPEQAEGRKAIGPTADIYALGAILYECLASRPPFRAATALDTILQVLTEEPVPLRQLNHQAPIDLETIAHRCLQKDPAKRYATAQDLADDLGRYLLGEPIVARPLGRLERATRWVRRNRLLAGSVTAVVLALMLGTAVAWWQALRAEKSAAAALESRDALGREKRDTEDMLYATRIGLAQQEWSTGITIRARQLLDLTLPAKRGWEYAFLDAQFQPERFVITTTTPFWNVAASPDGRWLVSTSGERNLQIWDAQTGSAYRAIPNRGHLLTFARDGRLAFAQDNGVRVFDPKFERELVRGASLPRPAVALAWSTDERQLLAIDQDGRLHHIGTSDGRLLDSSSWKLQLDSATDFMVRRGIPPVFSPDRRFLAQGGEDSLVKVWDLSTGKRIMAARGHIKLAGRVAFSPDGKSIASAGGGGEVFVHEVATGRRVRNFRGDPKWVWTVAYSPDGTRLVCGSKSTVARILDADTGEPIRALRGHKSEILFADFLPGGKQVVTAALDGSCRVWDASDPVTLAPHVKKFFETEQLTPFFRPAEADGLVFFGHVSPPRRLALSPDGRLAASVSHNDSREIRLVVVWDLTSRRELIRLPATAGRTITLRFSPDSRALAVCTAGDTGSGPDAAGRVQVFDVGTGKEKWNFSGPPCGECSAAYRPNGDEVVVAIQSNKGANELVRLEAGSGRQRGRIQVGYPFLAPAFVSDREIGLGLLTTGRVRVVDLETGNSQEWHTGSGFTAFAAGGGKVATGHIELTAAVIRLWDSSGKPGPKLEGHVGQVSSLAFSPDGTRLLSGGNDFAARVWGTETGRQLLTFADHRDLITAVAWGADGNRIATTCMDGALRVWTAPAATGLPQTDGWPIVYRGDFTAAAGAKGWKQDDGEWASGGGVLTGTLRIRPKEGFAIAFAELLTADLPRQVDIQLELEVSAPMLVGVSLADPILERGWTPFITGVLQPFGARGAGMLLTNKRSTQQFGMAGPLYPVELAPGRTQRLRIHREPERIRLFLNDNPVVSERIPPVEMPKLNLQGSWSKAGDTIRFRKVEVRAPNEAIRDRKLHSRVDALFARELLRAPVRAALEADPELTAAERAGLPDLVDRLVEDPPTLLAAANATLARRPLPPADLARARRQLEAAAAQTGADQPTLTPDLLGYAESLGQARYLQGDLGGARDLMSRVVAMQERTIGFPDLIALAVLGLCEDGAKNPAAARAHLIRMRDLDRPEAKWKWKSMPHLVPVMEAAQMLSAKLAPLDPDREAVKEAILNTVLVGWQDHNLELHLAGYTADAVVVTQRDEKPGPHDVTLTRAQLAAARRLDFRGPVSDTIRFLHDRWQIQVTGDTAEVRCRSVVVVPPIPNTFAGYSGFWDVEDRMRKEGGRWKIARGWSRQLRDTISDKGAVAFDAAHWARADAAVREAKTDADRLAALVAAHQYAIALPLARKLTTGPGATAVAWSHRANVAKALGEANEAETAAREAARLDPAGFPLPFWATK